MVAEILADAEFVRAVCFHAEQAADVRVAAVFHLVNVRLGHAVFFSVHHAVMRPGGKVFESGIFLTHQRAKRFFGDDFRQDVVCIGVGEQFALHVEAGDVRGVGVAAASVVGAFHFFGFFEDDGFVFEAVRLEVVRHVGFGAGAGVGADGGAAEVFHAFDAEVFAHHEALAVVVVDADEVKWHIDVARGGPGGYTRQHVNFTRLQYGEAFFG